MRGPYYTAMGLSDVLDTTGAHVDGMEFGGRSFNLIPKSALSSLIRFAQEHGVYVTAGDWIEHILSSFWDRVEEFVGRHLAQRKNIGFDVPEISAGFLSLPGDDWLRLVDLVRSAVLKAKPGLGIQFGAGDDWPLVG